MYTKIFYGALITFIAITSIVLVFRLFYLPNAIVKKDKADNTHLSDNAADILKQYIMENKYDSVDTEIFLERILLLSSIDESRRIIQRLKIVRNDQWETWEKAETILRKIKIADEIINLMPTDYPTNSYYITIFTKNDSITKQAHNYLKRLGYNVMSKDSKNFGKRINSIWFNPNIDINTIKIIALTLYLTDIDIIDIRTKNTIPPNTIEIGNEPLWEDEKYLRNCINYEYIINTNNFNTNLDFKRIIKFN